MTLSATINQAIMFATVCHANQVRKGTKIPYIMHLLEAGTVASSLCTKDGQVDQEIVCAAILHDVCEDAHVTHKTLVELFGLKVADLVNLQSEDKTKCWMERKQDTINFLMKNKFIDVEIVTLADKLSNMRAIRRDYNAIGDDLWQRFNVKDMTAHKRYYSLIAKSMKFIIHTTEFKEYQSLIEEVFCS